MTARGFPAGCHERVKILIPPTPSNDDSFMVLLLPRRPARRGPASVQPSRGSLVGIRSDPFEPTLFLEDERHLHVHAILDDLSTVDLQLLLLDPDALDVLQGLAGAGDPDVDGVLEALRG